MLRPTIPENQLQMVKLALISVISLYFANDYIINNIKGMWRLAQAKEYYLSINLANLYLIMLVGPHVVVTLS